MNPDALIAQLDAALLAAGADVVLRRGVADVTVRAAARSGGAVELVSGIAQTASTLVISPTPIANAGWPIGEAPSLTVPDPHLPRRNDKVVMAGRLRNVEVVDPFYVADRLVRIELQVSG